LQKNGLAESWNFSLSFPSPREGSIITPVMSSGLYSKENLADIPEPQVCHFEQKDQ